MNIKPIRNGADYQAALDEIAAYLCLPPEKRSVAKDDWIEVLNILVKDYEENCLCALDPITAIQFRLEQGHLGEDYLVPLLGEISEVRAVLKRQRPLTLPMIRKLHQKLHLPAACLIQEIPLHKPKTLHPKE